MIFCIWSIQIWNFLDSSGHMPPLQHIYFDVCTRNSLWRYIFSTTKGWLCCWSHCLWMVCALKWTHIVSFWLHMNPMYGWWYYWDSKMSWKNGGNLPWYWSFVKDIHWKGPNQTNKGCLKLHTVVGCIWNYELSQVK